MNENGETMNIKQYISNMQSLILATLPNERSIYLSMNPDKSYLRIEVLATNNILISTSKISKDPSFLDTSIYTIKIIEIFDFEYYSNKYHMKVML